MTGLLVGVVESVVWNGRGGDCVPLLIMHFDKSMFLLS